MKFIKQCKMTQGALPYAMDKGRSMIEMLGVLAIIGVLSIGAIAGYQKAMMKYKLNKQADQINTLMNAVIPLGMELGTAQATDKSYETMSFIPILHKLNALPIEMFKNSDSYLIDALNNKVTLFAARENKTSYYQINFTLTDANYNQESCRNITQTLKIYAPFINQINISRWESGSATSVVRFYGDINCSTSVKCIKNMNLPTIEQFCKTCDNQDCAFGALWNFTNLR